MNPKLKTVRIIVQMKKRLRRTSRPADRRAGLWGMSNDPDGRDQAPEDAELSLISNLSVGLPGTQPQVSTPAEQGDAPADAAERPAPPVPTPSREGLSADEVVRLVGEAPGGNADSDASQP